MIRSRGKAQPSYFYSLPPRPRWLPHCPCQAGWSGHELWFSSEEYWRPAQTARTPSPHQQTFRTWWKQGPVRIWRNWRTFWQESQSLRRMLLGGLPGRRWWEPGVGNGRSGGSCFHGWRVARKPLGAQQPKARRGTSGRTCWKKHFRGSPCYVPISKDRG